MIPVPPLMCTTITIIHYTSYISHYKCNIIQGEEGTVVLTASQINIINTSLYLPSKTGHGILKVNIMSTMFRLAKGKSYEIISTAIGDFLIWQNRRNLIKTQVWDIHVPPTLTRGRNTQDSWKFWCTKFHYILLPICHTAHHMLTV